MTQNTMRLITRDGVEAIYVPDAGDRLIVGRHANAVAQFLATGDIKPLAAFDGVTVAGRRLLTSPDAVEAWAAQGELEFEDIYNASGR